MKKLFLLFVGALLLNSCGVPFSVESSKGGFSENEDGSIFLWKAPKPKPVDVESVK